MAELTAIQHLTRAENIYSRFSAENPLLPGEHSSFLHHITQAMKLKWSPHDRKDMQAMLDTVVHYMGIPGAMYGHHHMFNGYSPEPKYKNELRPMRDFDGRWNMTPDMLEDGEPLIIVWSLEEDREWELNQEYVDAFRVSHGYDSMVA